MSEQIAFGLIVFFLYCYFLLFSLEAGAAILMATPKYSSSPVLRRWLTPVWESTNVFLVAAVTSFGAFFPGANTYLSHHSMGPLFLLGILLAIRAACMLLLHYGNRTEYPWVKWVLAISYTLVPCVLAYGAALSIGGIYGGFDDGTIFSQLPRVLYGLALGTIFLLSTSFYQHLEGQIGFNLSKLTKLASVVWFLVVARVGIQLLADTTVIINNIEMWFAIFFVLNSLIIYKAWTNKPLTVFFLGVTSLTVLTILTAVGRFPYLFYPDVTVYTSFTDRAAFHAMFYAFCVGVVLVIPALYLLYKIALTPEKEFKQPTSL